VNSSGQGIKVKSGIPSGNTPFGLLVHSGLSV
jgi:hypothetical protein